MRVEYLTFWGQTGLLSLTIYFATNVCESGIADRPEISASSLKEAQRRNCHSRERYSKQRFYYIYSYKMVFSTLVSYKMEFKYS